MAKAEGIAKLPVLEKKHLRMQVNNTKKNILYRRSEKREAIPYLEDQLAIVGENEAVFGVSLVHIYQDLALVHYELGDYELALAWAEKLIDVAKKTANKTHSANELVQMAHEIILSVNEIRRV